MHIQVPRGNVFDPAGRLARARGSFRNSREFAFSHFNRKRIKKLLPFSQQHLRKRGFLKTKNKAPYITRYIYGI